MEAHGEAWTEMDNIVTNGPFTLETWQKGRSIVLSRNPEYFGSYTGNVQRVELSLLPDSEWPVRLELYEEDSLDIMFLGGFSPLEMDRVRQRHAGEYVSTPWLRTLYVGFNVGLSPFDDPRVRRTLALATDRDILADVAVRGYEFPGTGGFLPPGMPGHAAGIGQPYDPDRARQLLAEAGYPGGRGFPVVDALTYHGRESLSRYLEAQWRDNLGVEIAWETMDWLTLLSRLVGAKPPHMFLIGWLADYPDPDDFLRFGFPNRETQWWDDDYAGLVEEARRTLDQAERMKMYQQADSILIEEAVLMPLTYRRLNLMIKPWVAKFPTSPVRWSFWKDVIIEPH